MNGKNGWKPACIVLAFLFILSWVFFGLLYGFGGIDFSVLEIPVAENTANGGGAVIGEGESNGVKLTSTKIAEEDYAEYGISPLAETAYTLTATVTPANAVDKTVDWSVMFVDPAASWANGKTVTDYVTVTPTSDGALTATVECLQAFGEQIKVIVASRVSSTVNATCTVDYAQKITGMRVYFEPSNSSYSSDVNIPAGEEFTLSISAAQAPFVYFLRAEALLSDVYTLAEDVTCNVSFLNWGDDGDRDYFHRPSADDNQVVRVMVDSIDNAIGKSFMPDKRLLAAYNFQREYYHVVSGEWQKEETVYYRDVSDARLVDFYYGNGEEAGVADEGTVIWRVVANVEGQYGSYEREDSYFMYVLSGSILASNMNISLSDTSHIF